MWERLDHPRISELVRESCELSEGDTLAGLLRQASTRPWAAEVYVVTSLGRLFLTTRKAHDDETPAGRVHLSVVECGKIALSYSAPHSGERVAGRTVSAEEALGALELLLVRLFEEHGARGADALSTDKDPEHPRLSMGARVRVVVNERHRTPHEGTVIRHVWHHKLACWTYYIEEHGRKIKKRYLGEDLETTSEG